MTGLRTDNPYTILRFCSLEVPSMACLIRELLSKLVLTTPAADQKVILYGQILLTISEAVAETPIDESASAVSYRKVYDSIFNRQFCGASHLAVGSEIPSSSLLIRIYSFVSTLLEYQAVISSKANNHSRY